MNDKITEMSTEEIFMKMNKNFKEKNNTIWLDENIYYYELSRRQTEQILNSSNVMLKYTLNIKFMTLVMMIFTIINVGIFVYSILCFRTLFIISIRIYGT